MQFPMSKVMQRTRDNVLDHYQFYHDDCEVLHHFQFYHDDCDT
jgi:hypothetical protein